MQISRRVTNGLAWAGLLVVVGVPSADAITAQFMGAPSESSGTEASVAMISGPAGVDADETPEAVDAPETAEAAPEPQVEAPIPATRTASADPVDDFIDSGRDMPSYITSGDTTPTESARTSTPEPVEPVAQEDDSEVAATPTQQPEADIPQSSVSEDARQTAVRQPVEPLDEAETTDADETLRTATRQAPVPMPLSMRPEPQEQALVIPEREGYPVIDEAPVPPAEVAGADGYVTSDDLENWEYGPLSDFLERRNGRSAQIVEPGYDSNGFFLDEGPNESRAEFRREFSDPGRVVEVYPLY